MAAQREGLLAWLENAITRAEQDARITHADGCAMVTAMEPCDCGGGTALLRRCVADRELLTLHGGHYHSCPAKDETGYLDEWTAFSYDDTCPVVKYLAEGYGWTGGER